MKLVPPADTCTPRFNAKLAVAVWPADTLTVFVGPSLADAVM